jgi:hypothetical protein
MTAIVVIFHHMVDKNTLSPSLLAGCVSTCLKQELILLTLGMSEPDDITGGPEADPRMGSPETPMDAESEKSLSETMEVHHHPDLHHKRKKFREYFIEFIMIFLAVTLGFFAEGLREHMSETKRAREYALMLMQDVIKDTVTLHDLMKYYQNRIGSLDTLQLLRRTQKTSMADIDFYYYSFPAFSASRISFNDATLQQVKNSGNLRYFHSLKLKKKIGEYDNITRDFALRLDNELNWLPIVSGFYNSLFDYDARVAVTDKVESAWKSNNPSALDSLRRENYRLLIKDPGEINRFLNFCDYRKNGTWASRIKSNIIPTLDVARQLIELLKSEYDFSDSDQ